jgi:hypothetical protein
MCIPEGRAYDCTAKTLVWFTDTFSWQGLLYQTLMQSIWLQAS